MNVNKNSRFFYYFKVIIFSYRYKSKRCATYEAEYASYGEETRKLFLAAKGCSITEEKKDSPFKSEDKKEDIEPIVDSKSIQSPLPVSTPDIRIGSVNIVVNKQGPLHKTKWLENGKKHRKNWTNSHVVLTDTFILFFKDAKIAQTMASFKTFVHG